MEDFLQQIEKALNNNLYYLALYSCLALPDICAALSDPDGKTTGEKYRVWYDKNIVGQHVITSHQCYKLRCSNLHQGHSQDPSMNLDRIMFISPEYYNLTHNVFKNINFLDQNIKCIDLVNFCMQIVKSVRIWFNANSIIEPIKTNYSKFLKLYPDGFLPFFSGIPIIA